MPNKFNVIKEVYRVLKPGGHFSISDIVLEGQLPSQLKNAAEMYAGCVSGAIQQQVYLELIAANGFENITIQKSKEIIIPDDILVNYLSAAEIAAFRISDMGIFSITVYADKPSAEKTCCTPGGGCC